jgi:kinetochore protein NDC80
VLDKKNETILAELDSLKAQMLELSAEYQKLTDRPVGSALCRLIAYTVADVIGQAPKDKLEEENRSLKQDKKKFDDVLQHYENRKRKVTDAIAREQAEIAEERKPVAYG